MKSPKLWAFSHRVEHLFFCQVPPKKSTVAVLDFVAVGRLRRAWWRTRSACGPLAVAALGHDAGRCPLSPGPRWRGGVGRPVHAVGAVVLGPSWPWPDTPGAVVGGGISHGTRPAGLSCHETPSRVVTRSGRWERLETPGAEVIGNTQGGRFWPEMVGARWEAAPRGDFCIKRAMPCSIFYFFLKKGVFTLQSKCKINNF